MNYAHLKPRYLGNCKCPGETGVVIYKVRASNGNICLRLKCQRCMERGGMDIPHTLVRSKEDWERIPILKDNSGLYRPEATAICERCGASDVEQHHWAPQEVFGLESYDWPTGLLCRPCHREWHNKMNDFQRKGRKTQIEEIIR
jgi:hypothetical protein